MMPRDTAELPTFGPPVVNRAGVECDSSWATVVGVWQIVRLKQQSQQVGTVPHDVSTTGAMSKDP